MLSAENGQLVSSLFVDGTVDAQGNNPGQGNLFNLAFPNVNPTPSVRLHAAESCMPVFAFLCNAL